MTLALILGGVVALYFIWFLFRLAAYALPVCSGVTLAVSLVERGSSYPAAIAAGVALGAAIIIAGRILVAADIGPAWRSVIALAFAVPAAVAGFAATRALVGLAGADGTFLVILSIAGCAATASAAWTSLAVTVPRNLPKRETALPPA